MPDFVYQPIFEHAHDETPYRRLDEASKHVDGVGTEMHESLGGTRGRWAFERLGNRARAELRIVIAGWIPGKLPPTNEKA